ncbi:outer membrane lipoprotein [Paraburkholderia megapolitana]|uniref:glycine zipper 2TM domain-containing protein n=1 Tax=Paraburkholderia megapolitana TaxID=420953 RepID=UPI0038B8CE33
MTRLIICILFLACLSGCATGDFGSPDVYQRYDVQHASSMEEGTVLRVRSVTIQSSSDSSGVASVLSAAAGAFLGSRVIGNGTGRYIAAAVSGAGTGFVTQQITNVLSRRAGLEIVVRTTAGKLIVVAQPSDQLFNPGDHVLLVSTNSGLRVTH